MPRITISEVRPEQSTLRNDGYLAALSVEGQVGQVNVFLLLTREDLTEMLNASHDILGDNPEPKPEIEKVAWPGRSEHQIADDRERAEAMAARQVY